MAVDAAEVEGLVVEEEAAVAGFDLAEAESRFGCAAECGDADAVHVGRVRGPGGLVRDGEADAVGGFRRLGGGWAGAGRRCRLSAAGGWLGLVGG